MKEELYRTRDIQIKVIGYIGAIVIFFGGLIQYKKDNERNYRKELYQNQFRLYEAILSMSSELATSEWDSLAVSSPTKFPKAKKDFLNFYYGKLVLIENIEVSEKMAELKTLLIKFENEDTNKINVKMSDVKAACLGLAMACRNSLQDAWDIRLETLNIENQ